MNTTNSLDVQTTVTTNVNLSDYLTNMASQFFADINYWLVIALIVTMIITQAVKLFLKAVVPIKYIVYRKASTFLISYGIGFGCGMMFLEGMDNIVKWSAVIGFVTPTLYVMLKTIAVKYNLTILEAALRMEPLQTIKDEDGK